MASRLMLIISSHQRGGRTSKYGIQRPSKAGFSWTVSGHALISSVASRFPATSIYVIDVSHDLSREVQSNRRFLSQPIQLTAEAKESRT